MYWLTTDSLSTRGSLLGSPVGSSATGAIRTAGPSTTWNDTSVSCSLGLRVIAVTCSVEVSAKRSSDPMSSPEP